MKLVPLPLFVFLAVTTGCSRQQDSPPESGPFPAISRPSKSDKASQDDIRAVARASNTFGLDLYQKLKGERNLIISPFAVSSVLSMAYAGARGETATEMAATLRYPFEGERLHLGHAGLFGTLSGDAKPGVRLAIANALWGPYDYQKNFLDIISDCYAADVHKINLVGAEPAINKWAETKTAGHIQEIFPPNSLTPDHGLVLTNAVYFKGQWQYQFKKSATVERMFRVPGGQQVKVPMMQQTAKLRFAHIGKGEAGFKMLELPYKGDLSMVIILPNTEAGLANVERSMTIDKLESGLKDLNERNVRVSLPRYKIESASVTLNDSLKKLGMNRAFAADKADFSGIYGKAGEVFVLKVFQRAFIEVNEEGSKAAVVAVFVGKKGHDPGPPVEFTADHPFLFLIRDNRTDCILFLGRLASP